MANVLRMQAADVLYSGIFDRYVDDTEGFLIGVRHEADRSIVEVSVGGDWCTIVVQDVGEDFLSIIAENPRPYYDWIEVFNLFVTEVHTMIRNSEVK